jgi:hypothetical protein
MAVPGTQVAREERPDPLASFEVIQASLTSRTDLLSCVIESVREERLFGLEVGIKAAWRETCLLHDFINARRMISLTAEDATGRLKNPGPGLLFVVGCVTQSLLSLRNSSEIVHNAAVL